MRGRGFLEKDAFVAVLLFSLFWLWMLFAFLKSIMRAVGKVGQWLFTPWGSNDDLMPTLRGPDDGSVWPAAGYQHYSALQARNPVPVIPDVMVGMKQALDQEKRTAEQFARDIEDWKHAIGELTRAAETWTDKAAAALAAGRNDLARAAIVERQRTQQRIAELEGDVAEMQRLLASHSNDIQGLESKLSTIYRRNRIAEARINAAETSSRTRELLYGEQVNDALSRFGELERAADLAEGRAESLSLGAPQAERSPLEEAAIDAQLAALTRSPATFGRKRLAS